MKGKGLWLPERHFWTQCRFLTYGISTAVFVQEGNVPGGLCLHAKSPKVQWSILGAMPSQLLVRKQISRKCFSLGRHESLHRGRKNIFPYSVGSDCRWKYFFFQKVQHFESAFASFCRPDKPCGAGKIILIFVLFHFLIFWPDRPVRPKIRSKIVNFLDFPA